MTHKFLVVAAIVLLGGCERFMYYFLFPKINCAGAPSSFQQLFLTFTLLLRESKFRVDVLRYYHFHSMIFWHKKKVYKYQNHLQRGET